MGKALAPPSGQQPQNKHGGRTCGPVDDALLSGGVEFVAAEFAHGGGCQVVGGEQAARGKGSRIAQVHHKKELPIVVTR